MRLVDQPDCYREHLQDIGEYFGHRHAEILSVGDRGGFLGEPYPLPAVIILRPLHLDRDETPDLVPKPVRNKKNGEAKKGNEYEKPFEMNRLYPDKIGDQFGKEAYHQ